MIEFDKMNIEPMLIGADSMPFDSPDYLYELKWDGERCIAYLDPERGTVLKNKRHLVMLPKVPELESLHLQVKKRCILDGELLILKNGRPDFSEIQKRSLTTNKFRIELASRQYPASFAVFDILYLSDQDLTQLPVIDRKQILNKNVSESERMAISKYTENHGLELYELAKQRNLEGVVAKRRNSIYIQGKRTKDWIKIKNLKDDDFIVCGYIFKDNHMISLVLGQYDQNMLQYKGHVTLGVGGDSFTKIKNIASIPSPAFPIPSGNEDAVWIEPLLVCTVKFMEYTSSGGMRQPVFKGLRLDKRPSDCIIHLSAT